MRGCIPRRTPCLHVTNAYDVRISGLNGLVELVVTFGILVTLVAIIVVSVVAAIAVIFFIMGMLRNGPRPPMNGGEQQQPPVQNQ